MCTPLRNSLSERSAVFLVRVDTIFALRRRVISCNSKARRKPLIVPMGVNQLWNILEPVKRKESLASLNGKTLSVDLSGWICEAQCSKGLKASVIKPHLRNLFFRVLHLTRLGVKLVFVVDGVAPELKWEAIAKRSQARFGAQAARSAHKRGRKVGRSNFKVWVNECCELLRLLGIPHIESPGEAEAMCAWLDSDQLVDGCITSDSDAFLYGAQTVYRDLHIGSKETLVESYNMRDIESELNLDRRRLIALAILLGCDYLPQGVQGIGKENALRLSNELRGHDLLDRFYTWSKQSPSEESCLSNIEKSVKRKALIDRNFPNEKVIQEFLAPNAVPRNAKFEMRVPDLDRLQAFCLKYMEWPIEYTQEKVFPLATFWQMNKAASEGHRASKVYIQPDRILKARVQQRVECYEVQWKNVALGETCPASFVTIETRQRIGELFPAIVEEFNLLRETKAAKSGKLKKKKPKQTSNDDNANQEDALVKQLEEMSLDTQPIRRETSSGKADGKTSRAKTQDSAGHLDHAPFQQTSQTPKNRESSSYDDSLVSQLPSFTLQCSNIYPDVFEDPVADLSADANDLESSRLSKSLFQRLLMRKQNLAAEPARGQATVNHSSEGSQLEKSTSQEETMDASSDDHKDLTQRTSYSRSDGGAGTLQQSLSRHNSVMCATSLSRMRELSNGKAGEQVPEDKASRLEVFPADTNTSRKALNTKRPVQGQSIAKTASTSRVSKKNPSHEEKVFSGDYAENVEESVKNNQPKSAAVKGKVRKKKAKKVFLKMEFSDSSCSDEEVNFSDRKRDFKSETLKDTRTQAQPSTGHSLKNVSSSEGFWKAKEFTEESKRVTEQMLSYTKEEKVVSPEASMSKAFDTDTRESDHCSNLESFSSACTINGCERLTHKGAEGAIQRKQTSKENYFGLDDSAQSPSDLCVPPPLSQRLSKHFASREVLRSISLSNASTAGYIEHSEEISTGNTVKECKVPSAAIKKGSFSGKAIQSGKKDGTISNGKAFKHKAKAVASGSLSSPVVLD